MLRLGLAVTAAVALAAVPAVAGAQAARRFSVGGTVEYAHITEDEGFLGSGVGAAGALHWHLTSGTSLEIEVGRTRHVRNLQFFAVVFDPQGRPEPVPYRVRWQGTATFTTARLSHAFGSGRVRPIVWGGGGLMSHGGTRRGPVALPTIPPGHTVQPGEFDTVEGRRSQAWTWEGGGGVDVRLNDRWVVRPFAGLRLASTGNVGPKYIIRTGISAAVDWP